MSDSLTALRLVRDWPSAPGAHLLRAWKAGIQSLLDLHVRPGLPRCRDAVMSDSWTSGRSGVGLAAYEAER